MKQTIVSLLLFLIVLSGHGVAMSHELPTPAKEQTVYVPAYSHIYSGNQGKPFILTITLSIRNIDPIHSMRVHSVDYFETQGKFLMSFLKNPVLVKPMESLRYIVPEKGIKGGSGANFIVHWQSDVPMNAPIIEAIMIGTQNQQGISFVSRGKALIKQ